MKIDIEKAKNAFKEYLQNYDCENDKIKLKIIHTYGVMEKSEYIAKKLNLSEEDISLASLIGLLHDIGRFDQLKIYDNYFDNEIINHADYGAKILFDEGLIRKFISYSSFDNIIKVSILNHSKYDINSELLSDRELLHCKIIRDADKLDIFRVSLEENVDILLGREDSINDEISDEVYKSFLENKLINYNDRKTIMDMKLTSMAYIFNLYFPESLEIVKENMYVDRILDMMKYSSEDTTFKIKNIRLILNEYLDKV